MKDYVTKVTAEVHPFTSSDWDGFAGAEKFEDGADPLMFEATWEEAYIYGIADSTGVQIYVTSPEGNAIYSKDVQGKDKIIQEYNHLFQIIKDTDELHSSLLMEGCKYHEE